MIYQLADHCLSVPGCTRPRLRYAGYCAEHQPGGPRPAEGRRCVAPLRCYCLLHLGAERAMLGPHDGPETIRLRLAYAAQQRASGNVPPVAPVT